MPEISRFYGITIYVYYNEHQPPHFHTRYGEHEAQIGIDNLMVITGQLPPRALGLAMEWASLHQQELKSVWQQSMNHQALDKIPPLP